MFRFRASLSGKIKEQNPLAWSTTFKHPNISITNSNLTATKTNSTIVVQGVANGYFDQKARGDILAYWQIKCDTPTGTPITQVGVVGQFADVNWLVTHNNLGSEQNGTTTGRLVGSSGVGWAASDSAIYRGNSNVAVGGTTTIMPGDVMEIALRLTATHREIFFRKVGGTGTAARWNGLGNTTADPLVAGTGIALPAGLSGRVYPAYGVHSIVRPDIITANFGATAFADNTTFALLQAGGFGTAAEKATGMAIPPTTVNVSNDAQLLAAIGNAASGQTIRLAPGTYAQLYIANKTFPGSGITITSDIPGSRAVINGIEWSGVKNITLRGVDTRKGTRAVNMQSLVVNGNSNNVTLDDIIVRDTSHSQNAATWKADALAAYNTWFPLWDAEPDKNNLSAPTIAARVAMDAVVGAPGGLIRDSTNITVTNCNFQYVAGGLNAVNVDGFTYDLNTTDNCFGDGLQLSEVRNATITNSYFSRHYALPGDHTDAIQAFTVNTTIATQNVTISGNIIIRGSGGTAFQGIFFGNETGLRYINITITNNSVTGGQYSGISIGEGTNCIINNNTVIPYNDVGSSIVYDFWNGTNSIQNNSASVVDYSAGIPARASTGITFLNNSTPANGGTPP